MTDFDIRPATTAEAEAISILNRDVQAVHAQAMPWRFKQPSAETFPPEEVRALLSGPGTILLVAHSNAVPAGYIYAEIIRRPETSSTYAYNMAYIHHISVSPAFRRLGIGTALLMSIQKIAHEREIATIALDVWSFNAEARAFFARAGLQTYNERLWNLR